MRRRKFYNVIKIQTLACIGDKAQRQPAYCLSGDRRIGGVSPIQASLWNMGTWRFDVKGAAQGIEVSRARVPKQNAGADQFVVALTLGNARRAKRLDRLVLFMCQPAKGRTHG